MGSRGRLALAIASSIAGVGACATGGESQPTGPALTLGGPGATSDAGDDGSDDGAGEEASVGSSGSSVDGTTVVAGGTGDEADGDGEADAGDDAGSAAGDTDADTGEPAPQCAEEPGDTPCFLCVRQYCCPALTICEADVACTCALGCIEAGGMPEMCVDGCGGTNTASATLLACAYVQCREC